MAVSLEDRDTLPLDAICVGCKGTGQDRRGLPCRACPGETVGLRPQPYGLHPLIMCKGCEGTGYACPDWQSDAEGYCITCHGKGTVNARIDDDEEEFVPFMPLDRFAETEEQIVPPQSQPKRFDFLKVLRHRRACLLGIIRQKGDEHE